MATIPFNKPYMTGKELWYIAQAHANGYQCQALWTLLMFEAFLRRMEDSSVTMPHID